jgi:hypothetical protein
MPASKINGAYCRTLYDDSDLLDMYKLETTRRCGTLRFAIEFTIPHKYGLDNGKFKAYRILLKSLCLRTEAALTAIHHRRLDFMKDWLIVLVCFACEHVVAHVR